MKRRRAGLAGAAIGAAVLFAPSAQAATFEVTSLGDGPADACDADCTLRDAVTAADAAGDDTVVFASTVTGTIRLTAGGITVSAYEALAIDGPGAGVLSVSGDADDSGTPNAGDSQIFLVSGRSSLAVSGLTLTEGFANGNGGAIASRGRLEINASVISGNTATGQGGGIDQRRPSPFFKYDPITRPLAIADSVISDNSASAGGGLAVDGESGKYDASPGATTIRRTTISGNDAVNSGAGVHLFNLDDGGRFTVSQSTISGNEGGPDSSGGGIGIDETIAGDLRLTNSTVSGNTAAVGGGVSLGDGSGGGRVSENGSVELENSTIASNGARVTGGGLFLAQYQDGEQPATSATVLMTSSIAADNAVGDTPQDLDRGAGSTGGGFDLSYSLVEAQGDGGTAETPPGSSIVGVDPQLGALAADGGPTQTHLPAASSPAIDKGSSAARLTTDQRGEPRRVDRDVANAGGGDGTDIGSVELGPQGPTPIVPDAPEAPPLCLGEEATIVAAPDTTTTGTARPDVIVGTSGRDVIRARGDGDLICAGGGNDFVASGPGEDRIVGGGGNDRLVGGDRDDRISGNTGADRISGGAGIDRLSAGEGNDRLQGGGANDRLSGGSGKDLLFGDTGEDVLSGGRGDDRLFGGRGGDRLFGGRRDDSLFGGPQDDSLFGGSGDDRLFGGTGEDALSGGPGRNRLVDGRASRRPERAERRPPLAG